MVLANIYVTSYNQRDNYNKYVNKMYKRKTYVKVIIKQKLNDMLGNIKEQIINETNNILFQFNKISLNKRKSLFSYSFIFRYVLHKLKLYKYVDRFKPLKTKSILKLTKNFMKHFINIIF